MIDKMDPALREKFEFVSQAILKRSPAFFAERGVLFRSGLDDLNEYQVAELVIDNVPFALMRHTGTPPDETEIYLPDSVPPERVPDVIERIVRELDLSSAAIGWQRQRATTPF